MEDYSQIREAVLKSVNGTLCRYGANRYAWMDAQEKDDIVSDAIHKALRTFRKDGGASFTTWAKMIACQVTIDRLKGHHQTESFSMTSQDGDEFDRPEFSYFTSPEDVVIALDMEEAIDDMMSRRSHLDSVCMDLYRQGYGPAEIAGRLNIAPNTVSQRLDRSKKSVKAAIAA